MNSTTYWTYRFSHWPEIVAYYRSPIWSLIPCTDDTNLDTLDSLIGFCINLTRMTEGRSTVWSTFAETGFVATEPAVGHDLRSICLASLVLLPQLSRHPSGGALPVGSENIPTGQYGGGCPVAPFQLNHPPEASRCQSKGYGRFSPGRLEPNSE